MENTSAQNNVPQAQAVPSEAGLLQGDLLHGQPAPQESPVDKRFGFLFAVLSLAFAGMILANACFCVLLVWHTRILRAQLAQGRQTISRYHKLEEPIVRDLISKLDGYGLQNRDFEPILRKHAVLFPRLQQTNAPGTNVLQPSLAPQSFEPVRPNVK
jgi:hypothetical protein